MDEAQVIAFINSQANKISEEVGKENFPNVMYTSLVSIDDSGPKLEKDRYEAHEFDYYITLDEAEQAMRSSVELSSYDARDAHLSALLRVDDIMFHGDADRGLQGIFNSSNARRLDAVTSEPEDGGQGGEIISEINERLVRGDGDRLADTLLLPWTLFATHPYLTQTLSQTNAYTARTGQQLMLRGFQALDEAGDGGTRRAIAYVKDSVKLHLPTPPSFLPPYKCAADTFRVQGIFRTGGLKISEPEEIRYLDGL